MSARDRWRVGRLEYRPFGFRAFCLEDDCGWYRDVADQDEGKRYLRHHATHIHQPPLDVWMDDDA